MTNQTSLGSLSIILAAYNEASNLDVLLPKIITSIGELTDQKEILVIDTQTPMDNSEEICHKYSVTYENRQISNNYGDAIRTGIKKSTGDYVIIMDSDGSHDPEFIHELWKYRKQADIVIASRYIPGGRTDNPFLLVLMSRILNFFFTKIVNLPALDVSNSFRLYNGALLRKLELEFQHFDIVEEILAKMIWEITPPGRVKEIPFEFGKRLYGKSKRNLFVFCFHFLLAIFKLSQIRRRAKRKVTL